MAHYEMYKRDATNKCADCGKRTQEVSDKEWVIDYRNSSNWKPGDTTREYLCLNCGDLINQHDIDEENERRESARETKAKVARETIKNCSEIIDSLTQRLVQENVAGTVGDYREIKSVQQRIKKLGNFEDLIIKRDIENLKKSCQALISDYISPKDRKMGDSKRGNAIHPPCCTPRNIKLEENDTEPYYYCDYCWETESPKFLKSLKNCLLDKLNKKMLDNDVSSFELNSSNYHSMLTVPDFLLTQEGIRLTYQKVEKDLDELLRKKGKKNNDNINNNNNRERERERERERAKLKSEIDKLKNKSNRTPEEDQELGNKEKELKELDRQKNNSPPFNYTPWIIGGGCLLVIGVILILIFSTLRKKKHSLA